MDRLTHEAFGRMIAPLVGAGLWIAGAASAAMSIVPLPVSIAPRDGSFTITPSTCVVAEGPAAGEASKLIEALAPALGYRLKLVASSPAKDSIQLKIEPSLRERLGEEGYELEATTENVTLRAAAPAGLFYGIQTLRQLLPPAACTKHKVEGVAWTVPCVQITDRPRFALARLADRSGPALHPRAGRRAIHRHDGPAQVQPPANPSDRRPGLADRDQEVPATDPDRRLDGLHDDHPGRQAR